MDENHESRLLAIFAHPDDESFGAGGLLAKCSQQGVRVIVLSATCGDAGIAGVSSEKASEVRYGELIRAVNQLGGEAYCLGYPDGKLAQVDPARILEHIASWISLVEPQVVLTFGPDGLSGHPDHMTISQTVTKAYDLFYHQGMLLYIHPSEATRLGCGVSRSDAKDGERLVDVDIAEFKTAKVRAIQSHASQHPDLPSEIEKAIEKIPCHEVYTLARQNGSITWFEENIEEKRWSAKN